MIPSAQNTKTISDMRENARKLLKQAREGGPLYILYRSKPEAVLLSTDEYKKLTDLAEDYLDSLRAQEFEAENKKKVKWLGYEKIKTLLK